MALRFLRPLRPALFDRFEHIGRDEFAGTLDIVVEKAVEFPLNSIQALDNARAIVSTALGASC